MVLIVLYHSLLQLDSQLGTYISSINDTLFLSKTRKYIDEGYFTCIHIIRIGWWGNEINIQHWKGSIWLLTLQLFPGHSVQSSGLQLAFHISLSVSWLQNKMTCLSCWNTRENLVCWICFCSSPPISLSYLV